MDSTVQWRLYRGAYACARSLASSAVLLEKHLQDLEDGKYDTSRTGVRQVLKHLYDGITVSRELLPHLEEFAHFTFANQPVPHQPSSLGAMPMRDHWACCACTRAYTSSLSFKGVACSVCTFFYCLGIRCENGSRGQPGNRCPALRQRCTRSQSHEDHNRTFAFI
jgi:hypothetical protein